MRKTAFFTSLLLVSISLSGCSFFVDEVKGIRLTWHFDVYDQPTRKVYPIQGSNQIFFYKNLELYKQENVLIDEINKQHPDFDYYVYDRKKKIGKRYNRRNPDVGTNFDVDSFLYKNAFGKLSAYSGEDNLLIGRQKKQSEKTFTERYLQTIKKDYTYPDTLFFSFDDELKNVPISVSKELDSLRNSKVIKWVSIYNPTLDENKNPIPARKFIVEINKIETFNNEEILKYFKKFIDSQK